MDGEAWRAAVHGVSKNQHNLAPAQQHEHIFKKYNACHIRNFISYLTNVESILAMYLIQPNRSETLSFQCAVATEQECLKQGPESVF